MKSTWVKFAAVALSVVLAMSMVTACQPAAQDQQQGGEQQPEVKAAMVTDVGGLGDKSFNDLSNQGLERAKADFGIETRVLESKEPTDYESNIDQLVNAGYNPIFAVGFLMQDTVSKVATAYPEVTFGGIDQFFDPNPAKNVVGLNFKEQEAAYLAGVLAALLTTDTQFDPRINDDKKIGFVGGLEIPPVQRFQAGFIQGAKSVDPDIEVVSVYTGSFTDQQKGKEAATNLIEQGCDIVFAAAGQTGLGSIKSAQENNALFIGVDADQFET
ncbi:MAG: BMP family ABC transporter substrate-binding protein, partial [Coriobacteriales bacterium]|nr:BMP family ABC transporter substrate-binding protein [Coriobacteriales bacterium]